MPSILTFRRGTAAQNDAFTGSAGELTVDNTNGTLRVHDGVTAGGSQLATQSYVTTQLGTLGNLSSLDTVATSQIDDGAITQAKIDSGVSFGKVLQIRTNTKTTIGAHSSTAWGNIGELTTTITPATTGSHLIITGFVNVGQAYDSTPGIRVLVNGNKYSVATNAGSRLESHNSSGYWNTNDPGYSQTSIPISLVMHPNTTSQCTVTVQIKNGDDSSVTIPINRSVNDQDSIWHARTVSTITVMEVESL